MKVAILATAVAVALIYPASVLAYDTPYFIELPPISGYDSTSANAVSADGSVVVGTSVSFGTPDQTIAWRWTQQGGLETLGYLPGGGQISSASDISADGSIIVGSSDSSHTTGRYREAFRWTAETGMVGMPRVSGHLRDSRAEAISADGSTIVGYSHGDSAEQHAVRWTDAGQQIDVLAPMSYGDGRAWDVSADGTAITGYTGYERHFLYWTEEGGADNSVHTDMPGTTGTVISADGSIVAGGDSLGTFLWTATEGKMYFDSLTVDRLHPNAMTQDASTLVGYGSFGEGVVGVMWDAANGHRDINEVLATDYGLDLEGQRVLSVKDLSPDGSVIVGVLYNDHAFVAYLPEPSTVMLLTLGAIMTPTRKIR